MKPPQSAKELLEMYARGERDFSAVVVDGVRIRADLAWAGLVWANLTGANLTGANLTWANLKGADLTRANLFEADLTRANLKGAELKGANLGEADLTGASLREARVYVSTAEASQWSAEDLVPWIEAGAYFPNLADWPDRLKEAFSGLRPGLTLYFNTRLTPFDRFMVDGVIRGVLGPTSDCRVTNFNESGETTTVRLEASLQDDLYAVAEALHRRVWERHETAIREERALTHRLRSMVKAAQGAIDQLSALRDNLDRMEHCEERTAPDGKTRVEVTDQYRGEHRRRARVFLSYSHDSEEHRQRVLDLANQLRKDGVEAHIDRYVNVSPDEGWPLWMKRQIEAADFILVVCTETYRRRFDGKEQLGRGKGATWEGILSTQMLYDSGVTNTRFIPILFGDTPDRFIPVELQRSTYHRLPGSYTDLLRYITNQPEITAPPVADKVIELK